LRSHSTSLLPLVVAAAFASPLPSVAAAAGSQTNPPVYKAQAREVVVDVVVTRGMDDPVTGLHAKDFVVMEDGKPQTIDFFEAHSPGKLPDNLKPLPMPPGVYTNVPPAPEGDAVNVLLLDSLNTDQQDQTFVYHQIISFLSSASSKPSSREQRSPSSLSRRSFAWCRASRRIPRSCRPH
jgi:hypothetical protein